MHIAASAVMKKKNTSVMWLNSCGSYVVIYLNIEG